MTEAYIIEASIIQATKVVACAIYTVLIFLHFHKSYQDFFTSDRKCLSHRRTPPRITRAYRWTNIATNANVILSFLFSYANMLDGYLATDVLKCTVFQFCQVPLFFLCKVCIYYTYEMRLYLVYGGTKYHDKILYRKIWTVFLTIYVLWLCFAPLYWGTNEWEGGLAHVKNGNTLHACNFAFQIWYLVMILVYDVVVNCFYVINMATPIKDVMRRVSVAAMTPPASSPTTTPKTSSINTSTTCGSGSDNNNNDVSINVNDNSNTNSGDGSLSPSSPKYKVKISRSKKKMSMKEKAKQSIVNQRMVAVSVKVTILATVQFVSTLIMTTLLFWNWDLASTDVLINTMCLLLMTPYYQDYKYYEKLCCCCILCCDREGFTKSGGKGNSMKNGGVSSTSSMKLNPVKSISRSPVTSGNTLDVTEVVSSDNSRNVSNSEEYAD